MEYLDNEDERKRKNRERYNAWREKNKEKRLAYEKEYREKRKAQKAEYDREYRKTNKEQIAEREYNRWRAYSDEERITLRTYKRDWYRNKAEYTPLTEEERKSRRRASRKKNKVKRQHRIPEWLTKEQLQEINTVYEEAVRLEIETGIAHHVDHIVPLCGENVSGLHVPWNLQILTASENLYKYNKY